MVRMTIGKEVLESLATTSPPPPWQLRGHAPVGGLWAVGFGPASDLLLVISVNGRGVIDGRSGKRVARDYSTDDTYDESTETAPGIGPLAGTRVEVVGAEGAILTRRTLPITSSDGWSIAHAFVPSQDLEGIFVRAPGEASDDSWVKLAEVEQVRALGFSPTGRTLIVAEAHTLHIWGR
jgi:hypothetical protein